MSERQDKELGHTPAKILSAHLFLWATGLWGRDSLFGYRLDYITKRSGTRPCLPCYVPDFAL